LIEQLKDWRVSMTKKYDKKEIKRLSKMTFEDNWREFVNRMNRLYNERKKNYSLLVRFLSPTRLYYNERDKILAENFFCRGQLQKISETCMSMEDKK
jgi:hypothetical protein